MGVLGRVWGLGALVSPQMGETTRMDLLGNRLGLVPYLVLYSSLNAIISL